MLLVIIGYHTGQFLKYQTQSPADRADMDSYPMPVQYKHTLIQELATIHEHNRATILPNDDPIQRWGHLTCSPEQR